MTTKERMKEFVKNRIEQIALAGEQDVFCADCDITEYVLGECEFFLVPENKFFLGVDVKGVRDLALHILWVPHDEIFAQNGLENGLHSRAFDGHGDFGHTATDWESVIALGLFGLKARAEEYAKAAKTQSQKRFFGGVIRVYGAALKMLERAAAFAKENGLFEMSEGLIALTKRAPKTLYEVMQTMIVYYLLQQEIDGTPLRTFGRLDCLLKPYFEKEEQQKAKSLIADFLQALDSIKATANIPFALGGTNEQGESLVCDLSYVLLDAYKAGGYANVKLHILCSDTTPKSFVREALSAVRSGANSIVFLSDKRVIQALEGIGIEKADAADYQVVGCYECGGKNEITCSCNAIVNIQKAVEYALTGGVDMFTGKKVGLSHNASLTTFDEFFDEVKRQLKHLCDCAVCATDRWEERYQKIHSSPVLSGAYRSCLEQGADVYCECSAKYNNSSVNGIALATAADSLYAIKKCVYEDGAFTLDGLKDVLQSNWEGQEVCRLRHKNRFAKFGTANKEVDQIACELVDVLAGSINGRPNAKGGVYRLGLFSIDWRWAYGEKTAASADGRKAGEPLSQNSGATFGADKEGATAHFASVAALDSSKTPNCTIVDIDLHSSAVKGENGLDGMLSALLTYFKLGGFGVHYNVLDTDVLIDAKNHPEKYPNLQVRLCGWNVLFSTLSEREKDEFIARSKLA